MDSGEEKWTTEEGTLDTAIAEKLVLTEMGFGLSSGTLVPEIFVPFS